MTAAVVAVALLGAVSLILTSEGAPRYSSRPSYRIAPDDSYGAPPRDCGPGLVLKVDGTCARPLINRNIFLYQSPQVQVKYGPAPSIPDPMIDYNYVFIKAPSSVVGPDPLVVPPPQQKTLVYVLSEEPKVHTQPVIELSSEVSEPEVFFINYKDGDNPTLPGGIDLRTALSQSASSQSNLVIDGGSSGGGYSAPSPPTISYGPPPTSSYGPPSSSRAVTHLHQPEQQFSSQFNHFSDSDESDEAQITSGIGHLLSPGSVNSNSPFRLSNIIGEQLQPTELTRSVFVDNRGSSYVN